MIVTNYWKNSPGGGVRTYLLGLVDELKRSGIDVNVIFREGRDPESYEVHGSRFFFPLLSFFCLWKIKPQVIHSQGSWYCLLPSVLYRKVYGCYLIHTFHTEPDNELPAGFKFFFQFILNQCDCVTFVSKQLEIRIKNVWGLKFNKTAITYAGVELREASEEELSNFMETFGIKNRFPILLALGLTAMSYKAEGLKILIKAVKDVKGKYPNIILMATRNGKFVPELRKFAKEECAEDIVLFTGDVDDPYIPLTLCDIYSHITLGEGGVALALLEAMSMGKPIIATNVGAIPEAIENGKNGLLTEPEVNDIAEKIIYLLQNRELAEKLGVNAKGIAEDKFTWKIAANMFIKIYANSQP